LFATFVLALGTSNAAETLCPNIHHLCYRKLDNPRDTNFKCWKREAYGWSCDAYTTAKQCPDDAIDVSSCDYSGKLGSPEYWESCMSGGSLAYPTDDYAPECWKYARNSWHCKRAVQNACPADHVNIRSI
ncbi:hypothetical protein DSO57_1011683, partial [Entomophthora muscae]